MLDRWFCFRRLWTREVQFYGPGVAGSGEFAAQDPCIECGLDGYRVPARLQCQIQLVGVEMPVLNRVSADRRHRPSRVAPVVAMEVERDIEFSSLLTDGGTCKGTGWIGRLATVLSLA